VGTEHRAYTDNDGRFVLERVPPGSYTLSVAQPVTAALLNISVPENSTAVTTVSDSSDSASGPLTYSIDGGSDAAFFHIDARFSEELLATLPKPLALLG